MHHFKVLQRRRPRTDNERPSPCRRTPPICAAARVRAGGKGHSRACRMWTPSGGYRAAQGLRHPACFVSDGACTPYPISRRRTPRAALRISLPSHPGGTPARHRPRLPGPLPVHPHTHRGQSAALFALRPACSAPCPPPSPAQPRIACRHPMCGIPATAPTKPLSQSHLPAFQSAA